MSLAIEVDIILMRDQVQAVDTTQIAASNLYNGNC